MAFASCARVSRTRRPGIARRAAILPLSLARAAIAWWSRALRFDAARVCSSMAAALPSWRALDRRSNVVCSASSIDVTLRAAVT